MSIMRCRTLASSLAAPLAALFACGGEAFEAADGGDQPAPDALAPIDAADDARPADAAPEAEAAPDSGPTDSGASVPDGGDAIAPVCPIPATIQNGFSCAPSGMRCSSASPIYS